MRFQEPIVFQNIIKFIKENEDEGLSYCIYSKLRSSDDLRLDTTCYIDCYPDITDDDKEVYSDFIGKHGLYLLFRDELLQDVIRNALHQKPQVTDYEIMIAASYYSKYDNFMSL